MGIKIYKNLLIYLIIILLIVVGCENHKKTSQNTNVIIENNDNKVDNENTEFLLIKDLNGINPRDITKYDIKIDFKPREKRATGSQLINYINSEDTDLNNIYIHLYPNAFSNIDKAPIFGDIKIDKKNYSPGKIDIKKLKVDNKPCYYTMEGKDNTLLKIHLKDDLKSGERIDIYLEYEIFIPNLRNRFGFGDNTYNFGNWYPIVAVYDSKGWDKDIYYSIGDPFYSDVANYDITIKAPKEIIIASTGKIITEEPNGNDKIWNIRAQLVRDFAWVASEDFIIKGKKVDGTMIRSYFMSENRENDRRADIVYDTFKVFNKVFGKYPYNHYSVVYADVQTGMEYPTLSIVSSNIKNNENVEYIITHETGHQWWYGVVGNDEVEEPWLDEALATYSQLVYNDEKYGESVGEAYYETILKKPYETFK